MSQKLLEVITLGHCSHEFSWPRRAPDGDYYQVCLLCATQYKYDWKRMRRAGKVEHAHVETAGAHAARRARRPSWVPRARRLKLNTPIRYRAKGQMLWSEGAIENLSQSGVLIRAEAPLPQNALVEMIFEMPEEISGQKNSNVLCQGRITRSYQASSNPTFKESEDKSESQFELAATVLDYKFLRSN